MTRYIDKDALAAEIKKRRDKNARNKLNLVASFEDNYLLSFLDTLEVKEVDLEKEFDKCCENYIFDDDCELYTAKRFFELGFKTQKGE